MMIDSSQVLNTPNTAVKIGIIGGTGERVRQQQRLFNDSAWSLVIVLEHGHSLVWSCQSTIELPDETRSC